MRQVNKKGKVSDWFNQAYLKYEIQQGSRQTLKDFASWLDVDPSLLSHYFNDRREPDRYTTDKVVKKMSEIDPKFAAQLYDIRGFTRLDEQLDQLRDLYDQVPPEKRPELLDWISEFVEKRGFQRED